MKNHSLVCSHCGAPLPKNARACKHCGSRDSNDAYDSDETQGLGDTGYGSELDDDFDYDEYIENEFGTDSSSTSLPPLWKAVVYLLLALFLLSMILAL